MAKTFKLRSNDLSKLNEAIQKLTISEGAKIIKNPLLEADGKFTSIINLDNDFNHNIVGNVDVEEEKDEKLLEKKNHLVNEVESKLRQALKNNEEINNLLKKIDKINNDTHYMEWTLNEKGNTALLKDKNAQIFKQHNNLCLSINDNVRLFGTVRELHDWLINHNLPVPKGITLTEATEEEKQEDPDKGKPWHRKGYMYKQDRVDADYQSSEIKQAAEKIQHLQELMSQKNMTDTNVLLTSIFDDSRSIENRLNTVEDEVEECVTTGDLGMATQYLATKKEEASLDEDWTAPEIFGLVDDNGAQQKFKSIIDGTRAVCLSLFRDPAFAMDDTNTIQMTKEEFERWKELADKMNFVITFAVPVICQKKANDYVNESIEKGNKSGMDPAKFAASVKTNVKNIFNYDLTDAQLAAMLKRNSKGKGLDALDPATVRTSDDEKLVVETKKAMGQSRANRKEVIDEIFNAMSREGRIGYAKYKKFASLMNNKGAIKIVKSHDPANNVVPQTATKAATPKAEKNPADMIYDALFKGKTNEAQEIINSLDKKARKDVKAQLLARNPHIGPFIDPLFKESTEEPSLGKAFLSSFDA